MDSIAFVDSEIDPRSNTILDLGAVKTDNSNFHANSIPAFVEFLKSVTFICGHNILAHDLKYLSSAVEKAGISPDRIIDTLPLSPLLYPKRPYHALLKDDKLQPFELNNPLNDAIKAKDLFYDEVTAFQETARPLKRILYLLLKERPEFEGFFNFVRFHSDVTDLPQLILEEFNDKICEYADIPQLILDQPAELAYCLALIHCDSRDSIMPPWVLKRYPKVGNVMLLLRAKPCLYGCAYCNQALDPHKKLKQFFHLDSFRTYGDVPLQEQAVKAAIDNKSILTILPTGGGKSITFQLPALISGETVKGLTIVISPLQSLMKDQVDNLRKNDIEEAVTINGLLDPIERAKSIELVADGTASLLYISPESLRSNTITNLILGRKVVRFVIDEAHCFSAWGQDFRVDYLYIADFIRQIQELKNLEDPIPVSCFTATAKQKVVEDIQSYFRDKLDLKLELFRTNASRSNLHYQVLEKSDNEEKYDTLRNLIEEKNCPTIVYVSRTYTAFRLAERLTKDGISARPYHGKLDSQVKTTFQDEFTDGKVQVMVATSAFGMGVDKKDIGMVIHHDISDSLENYIQEAGRAGRDQRISANCYVLFNEDDLGKHFVLLNQTKLGIKEIQQVWKAIKEITRFRSSASNSALEIARKAGWDNSIIDIETRVTTAIAALEEAKYLKRGQNMPRIFANSILAKNAQEAIDKIFASDRFDEKRKEQAARIIKKLFSSRSRKQAADEVAESRVDYISDHLGIVKEEVINIINLLREEQILADQKDLTAFVKRSENQSISILETYASMEKCLLTLLDEEKHTFSIKALSEQLEMAGCQGVSPNKIRTIMNFWVIKNWIKRKNLDYSRNHLSIAFCLQKTELTNKLQKRHELAGFIVRYLFSKNNEGKGGNDQDQPIEFSVFELKDQFEKNATLFQQEVTVADVEDSLFFLSRIEAIRIEGGFMVLYNRLKIDRLQQNNKIQYKIDDYQKLSQFYENKVQQIHIVGEYAKKMVNDYKGALQFVDDYFQLNYSSFLNRYFPGSRQNEIKRNLTPSKFRQLFGELSPAQLEIIKDREARYIVVAAGPGSGKTRILVHKLASLILMEDVKHEQLLMVTFSRAAATEFKKRLIGLIGNAAHFIEIKTFHSYCFDLLGRIGTVEKSEHVIAETVKKIRDCDVEISRITKTVLVIDEAQDMDKHEFALVNALIDQNEDMRVIAVGDDDQNIYAFRGSDSKYLQAFRTERDAELYELTENYRSLENLIAFSNAFVKRISNRLKTRPITAKRHGNGALRIVKHSGGHLITPLVNDITNTGLTGSTCILTKTNDEAAIITALLKNHGFKSRLIQSNDGFNLFNLLELRFFIEQLHSDEAQVVVSDETWEKAISMLAEKFKRSSMLEVARKVITEFEATNKKKKYLSDFELFVKESKLEDFYFENGDTIFVSTIHKAKGKEFDNVFVMLDQADAKTDEERRALYVAITRAKNSLVIHTNGSEFDGLRADGLHRQIDENLYAPPRQLAVQATLRDVWLDFFKTRQSLIRDLVSGDALIARPDGCCNAKGEYLLKFSKAFSEAIFDRERKGYRLSRAAVGCVVYWKKEGEEEEWKVVVPEVYFESGG